MILTTNDIVLIIISCLGLIQAILLCAYLFSLKDKKANIFLALMLLGLIIRVGKSIVNNYVLIDAWIRNLGISGILITGPFLWLYGKALFEKKDFTRNEYLHFLPFAIFVSLCWIIPNKADFVSLLIYSLVLGHLAIYLVISFAYAIKKQKGARLQPWYRNIVAGVAIIWFLYLGIFVGLIPLYILGAIVFSFLIYIFSYLLLKRHVFALEKYSNSTISQDASKQLLHQVKELFEKKEIYLDNTVSLKRVAETLSVSPREISQVINETAQMNFSEFVNHYRIARARTLLTDPQYLHEKIETIAYDCGFGNVTSFNLAFKADTKMTPSRYRESVVKAASPA